MVKFEVENYFNNLIMVQFENLKIGQAAFPN